MIFFKMPAVSLSPYTDFIFFLFIQFHIRKYIISRLTILNTLFFKYCFHRKILL